MKDKLSVVDITKDHLVKNISEYIRVSYDVSPWTEENFLADLPRKWELSFSLWSSVPVAYCIMSERKGLIHINQFMVIDYARKSGIGETLLKLAQGRGAQSLKVSPDNTRAIRFYQKHNWHAVGEENGYWVMSPT